MVSPYFILNRNKSYFALAQEYVELEQLFKKETFFEKLNSWIDMVIYPLVVLFGILFFGQQMSFFTIMTIHKTVTSWIKWFRYKELISDTHEWKAIVRSAGGPFISTNDETYHMYVYADGMQRLDDDLFSGSSSILTEKGAKSL